LRNFRNLSKQRRRHCRTFKRFTRILFLAPFACKEKNKKTKNNPVRVSQGQIVKINKKKKKKKKKGKRKKRRTCFSSR